MIKDFPDILLPILAKSGLSNWQDLVTKDVGYEIFKEYFEWDKKVYERFYEKIALNPDKLEKFDDVMRFYYFWCKQPSIDKALKPDFKLIIIFSIMESLMSSEEYVSFSDWLRSIISKGKGITNLKEFEELYEKYNSEFGSRKKTTAFIKKYYDESSINDLRKSLKVWDKAKNDFIEIETLDELISFVEGIRNLFIHRATYIQIKSFEEYKQAGEGYTSYSSETLTSVNGKSYAIDDSKMHIEALIENFEKGLIKYFSGVEAI